MLFSSFLASNLEEGQATSSVVPRGLLAAKHWLGAWARSFGFSFGDYVALHPYVTDVDAREVQRVHRLKRRIHVWTVNKPEDDAAEKPGESTVSSRMIPHWRLQVLGRQA